MPYCNSRDFCVFVSSAVGKMCIYIHLHVQPQSLQLSVAKITAKSFLPSRQAVTFSVIFRAVPSLQAASILPSPSPALRSGRCRVPLPFPRRLPPAPREVACDEGNGTCQPRTNTLHLRRHSGSLILAATLFVGGSDGRGERFRAQLTKFLFRRCLIRRICTPENSSPRS